MDLLTLTEVPAGSDILIDSNIFIYGLEGQSPQCKEFMERCSREEVTGVCLHETVNEVTHELMIAEARQRGVVSGKNPARELKDKFDKIKELTGHWKSVQRLLSLNLLFLPLSTSMQIRAEVERGPAGLLTNDSMIVACMRELGVSLLASHDKDFRRVSEITVFSPDDVA